MENEQKGDGYIVMLTYNHEEYPLFAGQGRQQDVCGGCKTGYIERRARHVFFKLHCLKCLSPISTQIFS